MEPILNATDDPEMVPMLSLEDLLNYRVGEIMSLRTSIQVPIRSTMNKTNNQRAMYSDRTVIEHTLYHVESLYVAFP